MWLLDNEEWIHRSVITNYISSSPRLQGAQDQEEVEGLREASVRLDARLPTPNPANTLRGYCTGNQDDQLYNLRLACFYNNHLGIKFFGLWNPIAKQIEYRTRTGFSYYAQPGALAFFLS